MSYQSYLRINTMVPQGLMLLFKKPESLLQEDIYKKEEEERSIFNPLKVPSSIKVFLSYLPSHLISSQTKRSI